MDNTSYISLSNQLALRRRLDVAANNMANMNTTGFKTDHALFQSYLVKPDPFEQKQKYDFVSDIGMYRQFSDGSHKFTDNKLDVALSGPGFLKVRDDNGNTFYTRDGSLSIDNTGRLVTQGGLAVLDDSGAEIALDADVQNLSIGQDGTMATQDGPIGTLGRYSFNNRRDLNKIGDNLYTTDAGDQPSPGTRVAQGYLESSNVNSLKIMQDVLELQRLYEANQRMLTDDSARKRGFISKMSK